MLMGLHQPITSAATVSVARGNEQEKPLPRRLVHHGGWAGRSLEPWLSVFGRVPPQRHGEPPHACSNGVTNVAIMEENWAWPEGNPCCAGQGREFADLAPFLPSANPLSLRSSSMKILLLGTTGYHPSDQRQTACLMLPECGVILDAGTAMYRVRDHITTQTLDIFLTHTHLDHVIGLTFLFDILHEKPVEHARVHGAADKLAALQEHLFSEALFPALPPIQWQPLRSGPENLPNKTTLTHFPLQHPGGAVGYRLDWRDRSMAYVTDTTARDDANYIEKIRGVDLLIHECYFPDGWEEKAERPDTVVFRQWPAWRVRREWAA